MAGRSGQTGKRTPLAATLPVWAQALYFLATGLWPIVHMSSFLAVTGPKTDLWLVRLFGAMVCVMGAVLVGAARRGALTSGALVTGAGSALVLGGGDAWYVARGVLPPIYLADAAAEGVFLACWAAVLFRQSRGH